MMNKARSNKCRIAICPIESDSWFYLSFLFPVITWIRQLWNLIKSLEILNSSATVGNWNWNCTADSHFTTNKTAKSEIRTIRCALSRVLNESLQYNQLQLISAKVIVNTMIWMDHTVCPGNQVFNDYLEPFCIQEIGYEVGYFTLNFINGISHKSMWTCSFQPDLK